MQVKLLAELTTPLNKAKGVACRISPWQEMPRNEDGVYADIVVFERTVNARMNYGQLYEQYIKACCRDVARDLGKIIKEGSYDEAWSFLDEFYSIASPETHEKVNKTITTSALRRELIDEIVADETVRLVIRADNDYVGTDWYMKLRAFRAPTKTPVTFTNLDGRVVTSEYPVLIGKESYYVLEKTDYKSMAAGIGHLQNHGLPSSTNRIVKGMHLQNHSCSRKSGEAEVRAEASALGGLAPARQMLPATNPVAAKHVAFSMMHNDKPFCKDRLINYDVATLKDNRAGALIEHALECQFIKLERVDEA